jgi:hypothetical protein
MNMRILIPLAGLSCGLLRADSLTYSVTPNGTQFLYQFTLTNTGTLGGTLFDLFLSVSTDIANIDTTTIGTPVGWGDLTGGLLFFGPDTASTSFIDWAADFSGLYDVGNGASLPGFSFTITQAAVAPITFALNGSSDFGTAQEISNVPEPAALVLLLSGVATIGVRARLRRASPQVERL